MSRGANTCPSIEWGLYKKVTCYLLRRKTVSLRNGVLPSRNMAVWSLAAVLLLAAGSLPLQAQEYTPLPGLRVSDGHIQYGFFSAGGCIDISGSTLNGVIYTVHTSKWQRRAGSTWEDVPGTEHNGGVCAYSTTNPGEYRLVAEVSIGGQRGFYSSENTFTIEGMTPEEMMPPPVTGGPTYLLPSSCSGSKLANHDYLYQLLLGGGDLPDRFPF